ncbi:MAG TPA: hypothetical protein DEG69_03985, partial [Flavobacteriaceae bacterium]|nr:hypothetical protein [Flavobacteriaceae bacterium]
MITGRKENVNDDASYIYEDYRDVLTNPSRYGLDSGEYDTIFHLAAMPRIQPSFDDPLYTLNNNAYGTAILCDFAKKQNINIVYAGSSS